MSNRSAGKPPEEKPGPLVRLRDWILTEERKEAIEDLTPVAQFLRHILEITIIVASLIYYFS